MVESPRSEKQSADAKLVLAEKAAAFHAEEKEIAERSASPQAPSASPQAPPASSQPPPTNSQAPTKKRNREGNTKEELEGQIRILKQALRKASPKESAVVPDSDDSDEDDSPPKKKCDNGKTVTGEKKSVRVPPIVLRPLSLALM
eukprot:GEMP01036480.1.p1 GENE.GEMP01036480.1~~GEMP01036480.1.p1  ORF type:complete len:145 (+),score=31.63 GEMP01036480.1:169-603(+)